jgi:sulfopyruvate decarboxylase TPP-binding subunit
MRIQTAENQTAGLTVRRRNPPPDRDTARSWPEQIFQKLREADIRQVTYVPDAGHARLIELCHAEPVMKTTVLTTEEGIGVLSGAWLGGERGVLLMQSSGVDNCINTLSLARVCGFPLLMIVTMRGDWGEVNPWQVPMGQITASNMRLAGAVVYEVIDLNLAAASVEAAARIAFNGKPDRRRSSLPAHARNQVVSGVRECRIKHGYAVASWSRGY